ncbi:MAG: preprotein translocase subunit SecG [Rhodothermales bacterium]|nr:preprotein translocase subunit SecG [Rhodothermales bacterium]
MYIFLIVVIAIIGVFLALVILLQSGKGGGLAGIASGGATQQILGTRTAPDILEKATWVLATVFIILCILTNFVIDEGTQPDSVIQQGGTEQQLPVLPAPDSSPAPADGAGANDGGTESNDGQ